MKPKYALMIILNPASIYSTKICKWTVKQKGLVGYIPVYESEEYAKNACEESYSIMSFEGCPEETK